MSDRATRDWEHYSENVEAILTDLIAELRERAPYYGPATMFVFQGMADRAEARLREVQGE